jgi:hypothetical protein
VKEQVAVLPEPSVAVAVTVVVPFGKVEPDGGLDTTTTPGQLSVEPTLKLTTAEQRPGSVETVMLAGQLMAGASVSLTVTVKLQEELEGTTETAALSAQVTVVVPTGKNEPDAGVQTTPRQFMLVVEKLAVAPH